MPEWLQILDGPTDLNDRFPILELFVSVWETKWEGESDVWTDLDPCGSKLHLQAAATTLADRRFIAVRSLPGRPHINSFITMLNWRKKRTTKLTLQLEIKKQEAERATQAKSSFICDLWLKGGQRICERRCDYRAARGRLCAWVSPAGSRQRSCVPDAALALMLP
jgi:hypothetical protein